MSPEVWEGISGKLLALAQQKALKFLYDDFFYKVINEYLGY